MLNYQQKTALPPVRRRPLLYIMSRIGAFFAGLFILGGLGMLWTNGTPALAGPTLALSMLLLTMLAVSLRSKRRRRATMILQHLASAVSIRMPIPAYLRAAAHSEAKPMRSRLLKLAGLLETGMPIGTAFHLSTGELRLRIAGQLDVGQQTGDLDSALRRVAGPREEEPVFTPGVGGLAYVLVLSIALYGAFAVIAIFVLPKFQEIFRDFAIKLPAITIMLMDIVPVLAPIVAIVLLLTTIIMLTHSTRLLFSSRYVSVWYVGLLDRLAWYTPGIGRLTRDQNYADFSASLAGALRAGHTLDHGLVALQQAGLNRVLHLRVGRMHAALLAGADPASAASAVGLPPLLVSLLKQDAQPDLARAMQFAYRAYSARYGRFLVLMQALLPVLVTLIFAVFAATVALSLFTPLMALIDATAAQWGGSPR